MTKLEDLLNQPEGRKLEFKGELPSSGDMSKTIITFANDAGGEIYIGVKDKPRQIIGLKEEDLLKLEEQISTVMSN